MINGTMAEIIPEFVQQWRKTREIWKSYEIMSAVILDGGKWQPYFLYVTGHFTHHAPSVEQLSASIDDLILFHRGFWSPELFEKFLDDLSTQESVQFPMVNDVEINFDKSSQSASLDRYARDTDIYELQDYDRALRYVILRASVRNLGNSDISYHLGELMEARGYSSLEDMLMREYGLRRTSHYFRIVLPIGIKVFSKLGQGDMTVDVRLHPTLATGLPSLKVGPNQSTAMPIKLEEGHDSDGWVTYTGHSSTPDSRTSLWITHPEFHADLSRPSESSDSQVFRVDVVADESRTAQMVSESRLVDLFFQNTGDHDGDGQKQWKQWLTQVDKKSQTRSTRLEVALGTRFAFAGARVYFGGTATGTPGVDLVALWSTESPPKALVVSATTEVDPEKSAKKIQLLAERERRYREVLSGYTVIFAFAVPVEMNLIPFGVIIEAARHGMAILDVHELQKLTDLDAPFEDLWNGIEKNPGDLHALVQQEFGSTPYPPWLAGYDVLGS